MSLFSSFGILSWFHVRFQLVDAGIDALVIASNTSHMALPVIANAFPSLPVLHIAGLNFVSVSLSHVRSLSTVRAMLGSSASVSFPSISPMPDCTARAVKSHALPDGSHISKVGLLGTQPTMKEAYLKDRLALHGLTVVVPADEEQVPFSSLSLSLSLSLCSFVLPLRLSPFLPHADFRVIGPVCTGGRAEADFRFYHA